MEITIDNQNCNKCFHLMKEVIIVWLFTTFCKFDMTVLQNKNTTLPFNPVIKLNVFEAPFSAICSKFALINIQKIVFHPHPKNKYSKISMIN